MAEPALFKWQRHESEIILLCVRWYLRYNLSYRDLEEMMNERSLLVDHTTIYRWVQVYAPELEKRIRPYLRQPHSAGKAAHNRERTLRTVVVPKNWTLNQGKMPCPVKETINKKHRSFKPEQKARAVLQVLTG